MGLSPLTGDGLRDVDRDEARWNLSDYLCQGCEEPIKYGDEAVVLKLVYPAPVNGQVILLDALEEDGTCTADPVVLCYACWDAYAEDLRVHLNDLFISRKEAASPSPRICAYCQKQINWGEYVGYAIYGELDVSPRTGVSTFKPAEYETPENAELICMGCLEWINEECDENVWPELWIELNATQEGI